MFQYYFANLGMGGGGSVVVSALTFRETLLAKLESISDVAAIVGTAIYPGALPMTHDLGADGPAITYTVATYARGHVLTGSDGMATARVQFSAWSFDASESDAITLAIWDALDRPPVNPWVAGGVEIMSVVQVDESDQFEPPRSGGDQWIYQIVSEYAITHRTIIS